MTNLEVRIVRLEPMHVASAYGFGASPEGIAWEKIRVFAKKKNMSSEKLRTFGFNNPDPSPGSPNYGYEIWLPVDPEAEPEGDIRISHFAGGLYAVTQFKGISNIGAVWQRLVLWCENSQYKKGYHQCLEELLTPLDVPLEEYVFNLYLPIVE